jgi:transcriptional regulator with XRE-family HTH domain
MESNDTPENIRPPSFAILLRQYRLQAGLTQEALAEHARLSRGAVSTLERGERLAPRNDTVILLATAQGLSETERSTLLAAARQHRSRSVRSLLQPSQTLSVIRSDPFSASLSASPLPEPPTPLVGR